MKRGPKTPEAAARSAVHQFKRGPCLSITPAVQTIFAAMENSPFSDRVIVKKAGIGRNTLGPWRSGKASPRIADLEAVANVLGLTIVVVPKPSP